MNFLWSLACILLGALIVLIWPMLEGFAKNILNRIKKVGIENSPQDKMIINQQEVVFMKNHIGQSHKKRNKQLRRKHIDHYQNILSHTILGNSYEYACSKYAIIYKSEMDYISRCIHDYPNIETGGQLFGFLTETGVPVVCYAIGPGPRANHQPAFFNQDKDYLLRIYNEINQKFGLRYIGEWHSHHQLGLARPSGHDATTVIHGMQKNGFRHFLLCIGNCDNHYHSTLNAFTFHIDHLYDYSHVPWEIIELESPYRSIIDEKLTHLLCHPRTQKPSHGSNYILNSTKSILITPDYEDDYWMNNKSNNLELKKIIDFLVGIVGNGGSVKPQLDSDKIVHLIVKRDKQTEEIIFKRGFPNTAPKILVNGDEYELKNDLIEWRFTGHIFDDFKRYYDNLFLQ